MSKYSTFNPHVTVLSSSPSSSLEESSYFLIISINITSPSFSFVQSNYASDDRGAKFNDSRNEFRLQTFSLMNGIDGSGGKGGLVLMFYRSPFSFFPFSSDILHSSAIVILSMSMCPLTTTQLEYGGYAIDLSCMFRQTAQSGMNMGQDRQMLMVKDIGNQVGQNVVQNPSIQNVRNQNGLSVVLGISNHNGNGNVAAARAEGNGNENNENTMSFNNNLQQASTLSTQTNKAPVYDSDGSAEVHHFENCYDNDIFNMFTQEEQYTKLLKPISKPHQVQQNDSNVIFAVSSVEQTDESLAKHKALEFEIERLLRAVVSQDIMSFVQNNSVVDTSDLQTELEPYNDMQHQIKWLQAQLGDLKGQSSDTKCASNTLDLLSQKLNDENLSLEYQLAIRNEKSKVVCGTCKQCLITANHDECVFKYVKGMNSSKKNQSANVSKSENQKKHKLNVKKSKNLGSDERLASPRPSKPRTCLRWLPTGRIFNLYEKITASSNTESESDIFVCNNASASNPQEPTSKGFPNFTSFLDRKSRWRNYHIPAKSQSMPHAHTQRSRIHSRHQSRLEESYEIQRYTSASSDKQELPQRTSSIRFQVDQVTSQELSKFISRLKYQDIKIKSKDIKLKIKIQDHKHAKGTVKEFIGTQGSKI
ncbi:hypothetical protein Tco_1438064 [Tanacetum coccineum]